MYKFFFIYEILYRCKGALYNKGNRRISIMHSVTSDPSILAMTTVMNYKPFKITLCERCFISSTIYIIHPYMPSSSTKMCEGQFLCNTFLKRKKNKILSLLNNELFLNIRLFSMIPKKVTT